MRTVLALVFSLLCLVPATGRSLSEDIHPLQIVVENQYVNICTVWGTRIAGRPFFVTARHCVQVDEGMKLYIDKVQTIVEKTDESADLALLRGGPAVRNGYAISFAEPVPLQPLVTFGYPYTSHTQFAIQGSLIATHDDQGYGFYQLPSGHGLSGAPVLDQKTGTVVGVLQEIPNGCGTFCPVSRGATVPMLRAFLYGE